MPEENHLSGERLNQILKKEGFEPITTLTPFSVNERGEFTTERIKSRVNPGDKIEILNRDGTKSSIIFEEYKGNAGMQLMYCIGSNGDGVKFCIGLDYFTPERSYGWKVIRE